jgi:hypothetical protein
MAPSRRAVLVVATPASLHTKRFAEDVAHEASIFARIEVAKAFSQRVRLDQVGHDLNFRMDQRIQLLKGYQDTA